MNVTVDRVEQVDLVFVITETIDIQNALGFRHDFESLVRRGGSVVLDLSHVGFVDSVGLGAILVCLGRLVEKGGDLKLCNLTKPVRAMLELVGIHRVLEIYDDCQSALGAFAN